MGVQIQFNVFQYDTKVTTKIIKELIFLAIIHEVLFNLWRCSHVKWAILFLKLKIHLLAFHHPIESFKMIIKSWEAWSIFVKETCLCIFLSVWLRLLYFRDTFGVNGTNTIWSERDKYNLQQDVGKFLMHIHIQINIHKYIQIHIVHGSLNKQF